MGRRGTSVQGVQEEAKIDVTDSSLEDVQGFEGGQDSEEQDEGNSNESARDTVERILRESAEAPEEETQGDANTQREEPRNGQAQEVAQRQQEQRDPLKAAEHTYVPPARFTAQQKEAYNKLPPEMKQVVSMSVADIETRLLRGREEQTKAESEAKHIVEAVRPYLLSNPHLYQSGYTESRIVAELIGTHKKLTDPNTALDTWVGIGRQIGVSDEYLAALSGSAQQPQQAQRFDVTQDPQFRAMQEKLARIESKEEESIVSSIVSEMQTVQNEMDANGRYVYPELHDDNFCVQLKPLVSALVETVPGISYSDALKRAYWTYKGQQPGNFYQQQPTRLPTSQNQFTGNRASQAAVSVRGRSTPAATQSYSGEIPKEAMGSARDTVRWAINQLKGN